MKTTESSCPLIDKVISDILKGDRKTAIARLEELRELVVQCEKEKESYFETILKMKR